MTAGNRYKKTAHAAKRFLEEDRFRHMSETKAAKILGCSRQTLARVREKHGLPIYKRKSAAEVLKADPDFGFEEKQTKVKASVLAERHGIRESTIIGVMFKLGVKSLYSTKVQREPRRPTFNKRQRASFKLLKSWGRSDRLHRHVLELKEQRQVKCHDTEAH